MKRDMKLVRKILEYYETPDEKECPTRADATLNAVWWHVDLLRHEGFITLRHFKRGLYFLTWAGHDLLEKLRAEAGGLANQTIRICEHCGEASDDRQDFVEVAVVEPGADCFGLSEKNPFCFEFEYFRVHKSCVDEFKKHAMEAD